MSTEEQYYEIGDWFFALDGCIYEYVGGDVGSKKICTMIDIKQSAFITDSMKKNANIIKMSNKMYDYLSHMLKHDIINDISIEREVKTILAQSRGE